MQPRVHRARGLICALALLAGCRRDQPDGASAAPSATAAPPPAPAPSPRPAPSASKKGDTAVALQLLRFTFATGVKGKEPVDSLDRAGPGQRVYAHMAFKNSNSEPQTVHVVFRVNKERRTTLDLKVEPGPSYRTWAFNTLKEGDRSGQLTVEVTDETGQTLINEGLPISPQKGK